MIPANPTLTIPLTEDADGVLRVGGSRISFDSVYEAYGEGLTVEEIAQRYPTISLSDLYAVIGYALNHLDLIESYSEPPQGRGLSRSPHERGPERSVGGPETVACPSSGRRTQGVSLG